MIYSANYSIVDSIIDAWVKKHSLKLQTQYKDYEVCSVDIYAGKKFQIWIDPPKNKTVTVHAWDYENKPQDWKVEIDKLMEALEEDIQT